MLKNACLIFLTLIFGFAVFPQNKTDLQKWELKGKIRQINHYDIDYLSGSENSDSTERKLTNVDVFNSQGNLSVQYAFSGNGADCFYKQTFYSYDSFNRKKETQVFQTEKDQSFCIKDPHNFLQNLPAEMDVKTALIERTIYTYNRQGKVFKESTMNNSDAVVIETKYQYNRLGKLTRYTITQSENRIGGVTPGFIKKMEFKLKYKNNGKTRINYRFEDGKPISKDIYFYDSKGRLLREEQFKYEIDNKNRVRHEILGSSSKSYFEGEMEILDWTIFDKNGLVETKLYILSQNDNEVMRLQYSCQPKNSSDKNLSERVNHYRFDSSRNPEEIGQLKMLLKYDHLVDNPDWIPGEIETRSYKFDKAGNIIQTIILQQENPLKTEQSKSVYEDEIIYFQ